MIFSECLEVTVPRKIKKRKWDYRKDSKYEQETVKMSLPK